MSKPFVYLDHAAATPLHPLVLKAMEPYFSENYGNPSSIYRFAQTARKAIDEAREKMAEIFNCAPREVLFTSGGTESNNAFIFGVARAYEKFGKHIVASNSEHDSVMKPLEYLKSAGWDITYVAADENGSVSADSIAAALRPDTVFVTVMYANNEIGTIQPIAEIATAIEKFRGEQQSATQQLRRERSFERLPYFHTDACQAVPYLDISVKKLGVDSMTINGGKIYGPKGVGALYVKEGVELTPLIFGGGQEYRKRSGTENVPAIAGFAKALELVQADRERESSRLIPLREKLITGILNNIPQSRLNGDPTRRLPNNVNVSFRGIEGEAILLRLDMLDIAASAGSACTSGSLEPSHVLRALGLGEEWTHSATRFTLGHGNTEKEVDFVLAELPKIVEDLRKDSPF